jgi:hypothetical protein
VCGGGALALALIRDDRIADFVLDPDTVVAAFARKGIVSTE